MRLIICCYYLIIVSAVFVVAVDLDIVVLATILLTGTLLSLPLLLTGTLLSLPLLLTCLTVSGIAILLVSGNNKHSIPQSIAAIAIMLNGISGCTRSCRKQTKLRG